MTLSRKAKLQSALAISMLAATVGIGTVANAATHATPGNSEPQHWSTSRLVRANIMLPDLAAARKLGPLAGSTQLTLGIGLLHLNQAAENQAYAALYNPKSPDYHRYFTSASFDQRFGIPKAEYDALAGWLTRGGLKIATVDAARDYLTATGSATQVASLMHTSFSRFEVGGIHFLANTVKPEIPAGLPINGVAGLNTLQRVWTEPEVTALDSKTAAGRAMLAKDRASSRTAATASSYTGTLVAKDIQEAYDMPKSDEGQGETAGVFGDGYFPSVETDLRLFEKRENLPRVPVKAVRGEGGPMKDYNDNLESVEWMLDEDSITGMAPKLSQLDLYFAKGPLDADIAATISKWASETNGPKQMNASFGECESDPTSPLVAGTAFTSLLYGVSVGNQLQDLADASLEKASMMGHTLFAAAGDTAGTCPLVVLGPLGALNGVAPSQDPQLGYPVGSDYATGVGGTVLTTNGTTMPGANHVSSVKRVKEVSWEFSGGGSTARIPEPEFQKKYDPAINAGTNALQTCRGVVSATGDQVILPTMKCRGGPDVAAMSGQGLTDGLAGLNGSNGYEMSGDGFPFPEGGTSLASPLMVGAWSRIQAASPKVDGSYKGLGFANETIYPDADSKNYSRDFFDITTSDLATGGDITYQDAPGWDYVSGWGVINVDHFIQDVDHNQNAHLTHPAGQVSEAPKLVCTATAKSPFGNAADLYNGVSYPTPNDNAQDMTSATAKVVGKNLQLTEHGPDLKPASATSSNGAQYFVNFTIGKTTYFAGANVSKTGGVNYEEGALSLAEALEFVSSHAVTGTFKGGTMTVDVPLSDIKASKGTKIYYPYAVTVEPGTVLASLATDTAAAAEPGVYLQVGHACATKSSKTSTTTKHHTGGGTSSSSTEGSNAPKTSTAKLASTGATLWWFGLAALVLLAAAAGLRRISQR